MKSVLKDFGISISKLSNFNKSSTHDCKDNQFQRNQLNFDNDKFANIFNRRKGQKLSRDQLVFIRNQILTTGLSIEELSRKYFICPSTLSKIKKLTNSELEFIPFRKLEHISDSKANFIKLKIWEYFQNSEFQITAPDIQKYLLENFELKWSLNLILTIMKEDLNLSFQRCLSRPNTINLDRVQALRWMFAIKFIEELNSNTLIWNIDEWTISRTTKINYSWSLKGKNKEI